MWKRDFQSNRAWSWLLVWFTILVGCTDQTTATQIPTVPLVPPTQTATFIAPTLTPTSQPPPAAVDIIATSTAAEINAVSLSPLIETRTTIPDGLLSDMLEDLAARLNIIPNAVQLARITDVQWIDFDFGCSGRLSFDQLRSGYEVEFLVGGIVHRYRVALPDTFVLCSGDEPARDQLLLLIDPSAEEFFSLAQQRVARELDLPLRRVRLAQLEAVIWTDTSLGCPQNGTTYDPAEIQGYRVVLLAGENQFTFHTDSISIFACNPPEVSTATE